MGLKSVIYDVDQKSALFIHFYMFFPSIWPHTLNNVAVMIQKLQRM